MYARSVATRLGTDSAVRAQALSFYFRHSGYRNVVPREKKTRTPQLSARFVLPSLRGPSDADSDFYISPSQLAGAPALPAAVFVEAPESRDDAHVYEIPARHAPSLLRVLVRRDGLDGAGTLFVRVGDQEPVELICRQLSRFGVANYKPSGAEAAFALRAHERGASRLHELYGARDAASLPLPLVEVGAVELSLGIEVEHVRVWSEFRGPMLPRLQVALQFRESASAKTTEAEFFSLQYRAAVSRPGESTFLRLLGRERAAVAETSVEERLRNHWLPVFHRLDEGARSFRESVSAPGAVPDVPAVPAVPVNDVASHWRAAVEFEKAGEWLSALESWNLVAHAEDVELRRTAKLRQVEGLSALGEYYLAEQRLRFLVLWDRDEGVRRQAFDMLLATVRENEDHAALQDALSYAVLNQGTPELMNELAASFLQSGSYRAALQLGLSVPRKDRAHDVLLRAALEMGWFTTFECWRWPKSASIRWRSA